MSNFEITCPCCESTLVVDRTSGEILLHKEKPGRSGRSFEQMMSDLAASKSEMEKKFEKGLESQRDRSRILEEKFKEAMKRAEKEGDKPLINPMDLD
jgi:predicted nucleotide-binding protein (sugar kinase/HSP70/actin superfamily)